MFVSRQAKSQTLSARSAALSRRNQTFRLLLGHRIRIMGSLISSFDACRLMMAQPKDLICLFRSNSGVSGHRHRYIMIIPRSSALGDIVNTSWRTWKLTSFPNLPFSKFTQLGPNWGTYELHKSYSWYT